jgi:hypothetical protein
VGLEASDDALVFRLDMSSKVGLKVLNPDALKIWWDNVAREIVLKKKDFPLLSLHFLIPPLNPVLIQVCSHPGLCVASIIKPQLSARLLVEGSWLRSFAYYERWKLLGSIGI